MNTYLNLTKENYFKTLSRLEKKLRNGAFAAYAEQKKQQVWKRLSRYARQIGVVIKAPLIAACVAAGLMCINTASAQTFTQQTGAANPLDNVAVGYFSSPAFVDIDNDGDQDVFIGSFNNNLLFYRNTGTSAAPVFTAQTSPITNSAVRSSPFFVDIDNDGDKDAFVGITAGTVVFYRNTGTAANPVFIQQSGANNPLNSVNVTSDASPAFTDIDNDGDQDAFVGNRNGQIRFYKNTGAASSPVFSEQTGVANPFNNQTNGSMYSKISFVDLDFDGDKDAVVGSNSGTLSYYMNTGTLSTPVFTEQTATSNPFNAFDGSYNAPAFVDIDGDGDQDLFSGQLYGNILYYKNATFVLPLQLLGFSGSIQNGYNKLDWQTSDETNARTFTIERSTDGRTFAAIATVDAAGTGNNPYTFNDHTFLNGKVYYRLKIKDAGNRFAYSQVIWLSSNKNDLVTLYPNPADDVINIHTGGAGLIRTTADIYDMSGRRVRRISLNGNRQQVNVQQLTKGIYLVIFSDGTVVQFIKQ